MKIAFIGFGNMAKAIAQGFHKEENDRLIAASPSLQQDLSDDIQTTNDNLEAIIDADVIILAVKPKQVVTVMKQIGLHLPDSSLLLSVVAGVTLQTLAAFCKPHQAIVRSMPNIAIEVQKGATPLVANVHTQNSHQQTVERLFAASSLCSWLDDESLMNAFTALSGSGPAYVFLFIESLINGAKALGIEPHLAKVFAMQTISGALAMLDKTDFSPATLRERVTSPHGTTAAALEVLQEQHFSASLMSAMHAANTRADELGKLK